MVKSHPPLPVAYLLTPVLLWEGFTHRPFHKENNHGNAGLSLIWVRLLEGSLSMKSQSLWSILKVSLQEFDWFIPPFQNSGAYMLWGLCNFYLIFRALHSCWIKSSTKAGPLSDPILVGNPNLGISSQIKQWATWFAFSVRWGRPLPNCRRYILWLVSNDNAGTFISVKSTSKCSKGRVPFNCIPGDLCWCLGAALTCEQAEQFWDSILHREESRGIKKFSKSIFLFCHAPNGLSGEFETLARGPESWEPATCHPAVPTNLSHFWWPSLF